MGWVQAGDYEVAVEDGTVVCRNAAGRRLKSVPSKIADEPAVVGLRQMVEWLDRHERTCLADVERWMVRSLPVPAAVVARTWPDPAWRRVLRDLVVVTDGRATGFLRDADPERGIGLVDLDGDTVRVAAQEVRFPHPVLLEDLDDLREFAVELGVEQRIGQLYREVWHKPADLSDDRTGIDDYAGGRFDQLRFLYGRTTSLGYQVRGGQAVCPVLEDAQTVEARVWLGDFDPYESTETGHLSWTDAEGRTLALAKVGPVAWSEGMRPPRSRCAAQRTGPGGGGGTRRTRPAGTTPDRRAGRRRARPAARPDAYRPRPAPRTVAQAPERVPRPVRRGPRRGRDRRCGRPDHTLAGPLVAVRRGDARRRGDPWRDGRTSRRGRTAGPAAARTRGRRTDCRPSAGRPRTGRRLRAGRLGCRTRMRGRRGPSLVRVTARTPVRSGAFGPAGGRPRTRPGDGTRRDRRGGGGADCGRRTATRRAGWLRGARGRPRTGRTRPPGRLLRRHPAHPRTGPTGGRRHAPDGRGCGGCPGAAGA